MRFLSIIVLTVCIVVGVVMALVAQSDSESASVALSPMTNDKVRELFQKEKYAEAEVAYLKSGGTDVYWFALFKGKQGKTTEAIAIIKNEIAKQETDKQKSDAIGKGVSIISDFSPPDVTRFLAEFENDPAIANDIGAICFRARRLMIPGEFDKANVLVEEIIRQLPKYPK
ncbi:MAG: hypothetical protein LBU65_04935 [Planctomycetaceae bacterium]|jgi:hypothetical protein|nr:hypothetical protein [Planctomycetaceae bacterium]